MSATNRGAKRQAADFYPTPMEAFCPLYPRLSFNLAIWEPACGDRRLIIHLREWGFSADGNDLQNGYDFLLDEKPRECILTNPPYSLAFEFIQHAKEVAKETFMLLRLNFLASKKRRQWFQLNEPSALFILSSRPSFTGKGTDATDYAWFYWGERHKGIFHL